MATSKATSPKKAGARTRASRKEDPTTSPAQEAPAQESPTPATPATPAVPERPYLRVLADQRSFTHYVATIKGRFFGLSAASLVDDIRDAYIDTNHSALLRLTDGYRNIYPEQFPEPFVVEQAVVTRAGLITGSKPLADDEDLDKPRWAGCTVHNSALAQLAAFEHTRSGDECIVGTGYLLHTSQMWPLLIQRFEEEKAADSVESKDRQLDYLRNFAARLFMAGVLAERSVHGLRNRHDQPILDNPYFLEATADDEEDGGAR